MALEDLYDMIRDYRDALRRIATARSVSASRLQLIAENAYMHRPFSSPRKKEVKPVVLTSDERRVRDQLFAANTFIVEPLSKTDLAIWKKLQRKLAAAGISARGAR
jgi:hypothetical protein